jgi:hypothetical protein
MLVMCRNPSIITQATDKEELDKLLANITIEYLSILRQRSAVKMQEEEEEEEIPIESDEMIETRPIPQILETPTTNATTTTTRLAMHP